MTARITGLPLYRDGGERLVHVGLAGTYRSPSDDMLRFLAANLGLFLGIAGTDPKTKRKQAAVLIPRNTPLPAKAKRVFKTLKEAQKSIVASVVEGERRRHD